MTKKNPFYEKTVVITGAGSGIGRATALAFAEAQARLHLVDIRDDRLTQVCSEAGRRGARSVCSHVVDCTDPRAVQDLAAQVVERDGRVDILQNGVGILVAAPVEELSLADWRRAVDVNLWSVINGVAAFVPAMVRQPGGGHLVNISSVAGLTGFPFTAPYTATKFAIVGLSESLSLELAGRGVAVTAVCPGMVRTNLLADGLLRLPGSWRRWVERAHGDLASSPEQVARQILRAVATRRSLVVPAPAMAHLWRIKRLMGGLYQEAGSALVQRLVRWEWAEHSATQPTGDLGQDKTPQ